MIVMGTPETWRSYSVDTEPRGHLTRRRSRQPNGEAANAAL